jgi:hypothetical protein
VRHGEPALMTAAEIACTLGAAHRGHGTSPSLVERIGADSLECAQWQSPQE